MNEAPVIEGYTVVRLLGRGGMGEVFHAVRTGPSGFRKDVALKRHEHAAEPETIERFLREARIAARLDHPNIVRTYDLVLAEHSYVLVMELLDGATLAQLVHKEQALAWPLVLELGAQVLSALSYAHALAGDDGKPLGLVHRDLTPRNVFVTRTGITKVLDFGIAKLLAATGPALTREGGVAGTLEMLPPERAGGNEGDARSDLYQVGALLYWALSGKYPHGKGSPADVLARAVHGAPISLDDLRPDLPDKVRAVIARAMAKEPAARHANASEMLADVRDALAGADASSTLADAVTKYQAANATDSRATPKSASQRHDDPSPNPRWRMPALAVLGVAGLSGSFALGRSVPMPPAPSASVAPAVDGGVVRWQRETFRRGSVIAARYAPDARSFVYTAAWGVDAPTPFIGTLGAADARLLGVPHAHVLAVSRQGSIALLREPSLVYGYCWRGTLATASLAGEAPRDIALLVQDADFGNDGRMAIVRWEGDKAQLEYPQGKVLYATDDGWIGEVRISPDGKSIAFLQHPDRFDDGGLIALAKEDGTVTELTPQFTTAQGLAWHPSGREVLFSASTAGSTRAVQAVNIDDRKVRVVLGAPGGVTLFDASADSLLVRHDLREQRMFIRGSGEDQDRDLSWFDASTVVGVSRDGKRIALTEGGGDAVGHDYGVFVRGTDGSPAVRLGTGIGIDFTPDEKGVLVLNVARDELSVIPLGAGASKTILKLPRIDSGALFPDGKRLLYAQTREGHGPEVHILDLETKDLTNVAGDDVTMVPVGNPIAPDGRHAVLRDGRTDSLVLVPFVPGEKKRPFPGAVSGEQFAGWSSDSKYVYVARFETVPGAIDRVDVETGARKPWRKIDPDGRAGTEVIGDAVVGQNGTYGYTILRMLGVLYRIEGVTL